MSEPLKYPSFRLVWSGQFINLAGNALFVVAIALFLLQRADPARALGLVLGFDAVGSVAALLLGGALADRYRRTMVMVCSDLVGAAGVAAIALAGAGASAWLLGACAAVVGIGSGLYRPASSALLPTLLPAEVLPQANALRAMSSRLAAVLGAALGGALVAATSPGIALWIDCGTFLISTLTLVGIREASQPRASDEDSLLSEVQDGFRYVLKRPWMLSVMVQGTLAVAFVTGPVTVALPLLVGSQRQAWYGLIIAADAVGAVAGVTIGASLKSRLPGRAAMLAMLLQVPELGAIALRCPPAVLLVTAAVAGVGMSVFGVIWVTTLQKSVPRDHLGRVFALDALTSTALAPVGLGLAGWAIAMVGVPDVAWAAMAILVGSVLLPLAVPGVREFSDPPMKPGETQDAPGVAPRSGAG